MGQWLPDRELSDPFPRWSDAFDPEELSGGASPWGNSRYSCFEQCPRRYWAMHVMNWEHEVPKEPLEVGGAVHEACSIWYDAINEHFDSDGKFIGGCGAREMLTFARSKVFHFITRITTVTPGVAAETRRLIDSWLQWMDHGAHDWRETMATEVLIEVDGSFPYSTRIDRVLWSEERDGPVLAERKTASRQYEGAVNDYDAQVLGQIYCWNNSSWFEEYGPLKGVQLDMMIKTSPPKFYALQYPMADRTILEDWARSRQAVYDQLRVCEDADYWPMHLSNCVKFTRRCALHNYCVTGGTGMPSGWKEKEE